MTAPRIGSAQYELGADLRPLRKDLGDATGEIKKTGAAAEQAFARQGKGAADKMATSQGVLVRQSAELRKGVLAGVGIGGGVVAFSALTGAVGAAVDAVAGAVNAAADLQDEMATINTVAKLTDAQLDTLKETIQDLSEETGRSTGELTAGFYDLVSAGVSVDRAIDVLRDSTTLATGALASTAEAVDLITSTLNAWKLEAAESTRVIDVWAQAVADGKVTASELAASIAQIAPLAAAAGVSIEEVAAGFAVMTAQGVPATRAATLQAAAINALLKPNEQLLELQGRLSGTTFERILREEGLAAALEAVRQAAGGNTATITASLGSIEAYNALLLTTGDNADAFQGALGRMTKAGKEGGVALGQLAEKTDTLAFRQERLAAKQARLGQDIGEALMPFAEGVTDIASGAIDVLRDVAEGLDDVLKAAALLRGGELQGEVEALAAEMSGPGAKAFLEYALLEERVGIAGKLLGDRLDTLEIKAINQRRAQEAIVAISDKTGKSLEEVAEAAFYELDALNDASFMVADGTIRYERFLAALDNLYAQFGLVRGAIDDQTTVTRVNATATEEAVAVQRKWLLTTAEGRKELLLIDPIQGAYGTALHQSARAADEATEAFEPLPPAIEGIGDAMSHVSEVTRHEFLQAAKEAERGWTRLLKGPDLNRKSINELERAIDKWQRRLTLAIAIGRQDLMAHAATQLAILRAELAEREKVRAEYKRQKEALDRIAEAADGIPRRKVVRLVMQGGQDAVGTLTTIQAILGTIRGIDIGPAIRRLLGNLNVGGGPLPGSAVGGIPEGWTWVGERGPELAYFGSRTPVLDYANAMRFAQGMGGSQTVDRRDQRRIEINLSVAQPIKTRTPADTVWELRRAVALGEIG